MNLAVVILAAGEGTRMKSKKPKVLHEILGRPMVTYVIESARSLRPDRIVVVLGHGADHVLEALDGDVEVAIQERQLGTGHAVMQALPRLEGFDGQVAVVCGDTPLLSPDTLGRLVAAVAEGGATVSLLTAELPDPKGYGRVIRERGTVVAIVEERDATDEQREIREINAGTYCFEKEALVSALGEIRPDNDQAEYYLTDAVGILVRRDQKVLPIAAEDPVEALGVNSRVQLAEAAALMRSRINAAHMLAGVTIIDPATAYISPGVAIGKDTIIAPNCHLEGSTSVGSECSIGPNVRIVDSTIGDRVCVEQAVVKSSTVGNGAILGPFCHLRKGTKVGAGAKIGGFVETKQSEIGEDAKVPHLSYVGDAFIGPRANIGAGSITCNFDGFEKHRTVVEEDAFVGSDTMLVAPVTIGKGAVTGAGSTITGDVPPGSLGVERSDQKNIAGWADRRRKKKSGKRGGKA